MLRPAYPNACMSEEPTPVRSVTLTDISAPGPKETCFHCVPLHSANQALEIYAFYFSNPATPTVPGRTVPLAALCTSSKRDKTELQRKMLDMQNMRSMREMHLGLPVRAKNLPALLYRSRKLLKNRLGVFPTNACVCDGDAVLKAGRPLLGNLLGA